MLAKGVLDSHWLLLFLNDKSMSSDYIKYHTQCYPMIIHCPSDGRKIMQIISALVQIYRFLKMSSNHFIPDAHGLNMDMFSFACVIEIWKHFEYALW